jgi:hypothetical protein
MFIVGVQEQDIFQAGFPLPLGIHHGAQPEPGGDILFIQLDNTKQ